MPASQNEDMSSEKSQESVRNGATRHSENFGGSGFQIVNFKIPIRKEQLCEEPSNDSQFWVKDRLNLGSVQEKDVLSDLERVSNKLCGSGSNCLQILNNDFFDTLYSIIYYVDSMSSRVRKEVIQLLQIGLKNTKNYMDGRKMWDFA